jgi:hypothetical protein
MSVNQENHLGDAVVDRETVQKLSIADGTKLHVEYQTTKGALTMEEATTKVVIVQDGDGNNYDLSECECDNTHEQNDTVCRWCWAR